jgi:signal transduction histidine kinase/ActR/RegA family two-component response regulator
MNKWKLFGLVLIFIVGCTSSGKETINIGFSQCLSDDEWRIVMNSEIFTEADLINDRDVNIIYRTAHGNNEVQIEQIKELMAQPIDLLIVSPNEAAPLTGIVSQAYKEGIPVIVVDRNINSSDFTSFIGGNNFDVGITAGNIALSMLAEKNIDSARILEVTGLPGSSPAEQRQNGFGQSIKENSGHSIKILNADWHEETAFYKLDSLYREETEGYDLIFAHNDEMAHAAFRVTRNFSKEAVIIGVDGLITERGGVPMILDNKIDATISYPTGGDIAVRTAINIIDGREVEKYNYLNTFPVDSRNAETLYYEGIRLQTQKEKLRELINRYDSLYLNVERKNVLIFIFSVLIVLLLLSSGVIFYFLSQKNKANRLLLNKQEVIDNQNRYIKKQRDHLLSAVKKMEELTEVKTSFFTNISHEFKTLLTILKLDIEKLDQKNTTVHHLRNNVIKLTRTLNQLLHFQKVESPEYPVKFEYGDISALIYEIAENLRPSAEKKGLDFKVKATKLFCDFDRDIIEKTVRNILHNAIKYTKEGSIILQLFREEDLVKIEIKDTGIGIPEDEKQKIFERFEHSSISDFSEDSSGIGLDFSMNLILMHEGNIEVESCPGKGSVFSVKIPVKQKSPNVVNDQTEVPETNELKPKILVVEDSDQIRQRICEILGSDYRIIEARDGMEGYEQTKYHTPDLIISDLLMPKMDGLQFSQKIFENPGTMGIPFILLTAVNTEESIIKGYKIGVDDYITKPFNPETLKARVRNLFEKRLKINGTVAGTEFFGR